MAGTIHELEVPAEQVVAFRVARQHLDRRAPRRRLLAVVRRLVGVQAQVPSAATASLAARVEGLTPAHVEDALHRAKTLARTWCLRSTVHLVARQDHTLLAGALGPEVGGLKRWLTRRGLTEPFYAELRAAILAVLDRGPRTRADLEAEVSKHLDGAAEFFGSWGGVMKLLALEGLVVLGSRRAQETTFVRADSWWPGPLPRAPEDAPSILLGRYLAAFGPATLTDFAYWSGLPVARAKEALAGLGGTVLTVGVNGRAAHLLREDLPALRRAGRVPSVRLPPSFDAFLLGHRDKSLLLAPEHYKAVFRAAGWVSQTILVNGRVAGTWEQQQRGSVLEIVVRPFDRLPRRVWASVEAEAALIAEGTGLDRARVT